MSNALCAMRVATHFTTFKMTTFYTVIPEGLILAVRVLPGAHRCGIQGVWNETHLKIALMAPAVDGKANQALTQFLKETLNVRAADIEITTGGKARCKILKIKTKTPDALINLLK